MKLVLCCCKRHSVSLPLQRQEGFKLYSWNMCLFFGWLSFVLLWLPVTDLMHMAASSTGNTGVDSSEIRIHCNVDVCECQCMPEHVCGGLRTTCWGEAVLPLKVLRNQTCIAKKFNLLRTFTGPRIQF